MRWHYHSIPIIRIWLLENLTYFCQRSLCFTLFRTCLFAVVLLVKMNAENIKFELKEGARADCSVLLYTPEDEQIYVKNKQLKSGDAAYVCRVKKCTARVYLTADNSRVFSKAGNMVHIHGSQRCEMEKVEALNKIKKNARAAITTPKKFSMTFSQSKYTIVYVQIYNICTYMHMCDALCVHMFVFIFLVFYILYSILLIIVLHSISQ